MRLDGEFKDEQARKEHELHEKLERADKALKEAIAERIKLGAEAVRVELTDFATYIPESPPTYNALMGRRMTASEIKECRDAPFLCETYLYYLMGKEDARTVLALFNSVCRVLGIQDGYHELQEPWYRAQDAERRRKIDHFVHQRECAIGKGHTLSGESCKPCAAKRDQWKSDYEKKIGERDKTGAFAYDPSRGCDYRRNLRQIQELMDEDEWKQFKKRKEFKKPRKRTAKAGK